MPSDWKMSKVSPLFKGGKAYDMDNYRPISVLCISSKIFERAIHSQLCGFLEENQLLSPYQCGFRKGYSTELATIALSDSILQSMDQGMLTGSVFIDLKKAFDTVHHDLLIEKLSRYGIRNSELSWFKDYLNNRSQVVQYENSFCKPSKISTGVPQGSVLGPLLFILFINDLPNCIVKCSILMYADGTVLFFSAKRPEVIESTLNSQLAILNDWLQNNLLFLNVKKTEVVLFGTSGNLAKVDEFTITIGQKQIKRVTEYKY